MKKSSLTDIQTLQKNYRLNERQAKDVKFRLSKFLRTLPERVTIRVHLKISETLPEFPSYDIEEYHHYRNSKNEILHCLFGALFEKGQKVKQKGVSKLVTATAEGEGGESGSAENVIEDEVIVISALEREELEVYFIHQLEFKREEYLKGETDIVIEPGDLQDAEKEEEPEQEEEEDLEAEKPEPEAEQEEELEEDVEKEPEPEVEEEINLAKEKAEEEPKQEVEEELEIEEPVLEKEVQAPAAEEKTKEEKEQEKERPQQPEPPEVELPAQKPSEFEALHEKVRATMRENEIGIQAAMRQLNIQDPSLRKQLLQAPELMRLEVNQKKQLETEKVAAKESEPEPQEINLRNNPRLFAEKIRKEGHRLRPAATLESFYRLNQTRFKEVLGVTFTSENDLVNYFKESRNKEVLDELKRKKLLLPEVEKALAMADIEREKAKQKSMPEIRSAQQAQENTMRGGGNAKEQQKSQEQVNKDKNENYKKIALALLANQKKFVEWWARHTENQLLEELPGLAGVSRDDILQAMRVNPELARHMKFFDPKIEKNHVEKKKEAENLTVDEKAKKTKEEEEKKKAQAEKDKKEKEGEERLEREKAEKEREERERTEAEIEKRRLQEIADKKAKEEKEQREREEEKRRQAEQEREKYRQIAEALLDNQREFPDWWARHTPEQLMQELPSLTGLSPDEIRKAMLVSPTLAHHINFFDPEAAKQHEEQKQKSDMLKAQIIEAIESSPHMFADEERALAFLILKFEGQHSQEEIVEAYRSKEVELVLRVTREQNFEQQGPGNKDLTDSK